MRKRFVILEHDHPFLHWDLMLEADDTLRSWRLLEPVALDRWIPAESIPDHRVDYLDYEGPVSRDRGSVKRVHSGLFESINNRTADDRATAVDSTEQCFRLYEANFAETAVCRTSEAVGCAWRFSRAEHSGPVS